MGMRTNFIFVRSSAPVACCRFGVRKCWACFYVSIFPPWLPTGDIAFRFLNYIQAQHRRKQKRQLRTQQNLSWEEIAQKYQNEEDTLNGSHVVICDINKEMLKIGKKKAYAQGYKTGKSYRKCAEEMLILYNNPI